MPSEENGRWLVLPTLGANVTLFGTLPDRFNFCDKFLPGLLEWWYRGQEAFYEQCTEGRAGDKRLKCVSTGLQLHK